MELDHRAADLELLAPRLLPREHLDAQAAQTPDVRREARFRFHALWRHPRQRSINLGRQTEVTSTFLQESTVSQVAQLDRLSILGQQDISTLQVAMDHPDTVEVPESFQDLARILATDGLTQTPVPFAKVSDASAAHVLQIDAEYVVLSYFSTVVVDYVLVIQELKPVDLMLQCFDF